MAGPDASFRFDGADVPVVAGDSVLMGLLRAGHRPTPGGALCHAGDCPGCLCVVDGVAHVRTCQIPATAALEVRSQPRDHVPLPPFDAAADDVAVEHRWADVVVIGAGRSGRAEVDRHIADGRSVAVLDAGAGEEVVGIYAGPQVVARTPDGTVQIRCDEVVVATGAAWILPVVPGSHLAGIVTPHAAEVLRSGGLDLGRTVGVGDVGGVDVDATAPGELLRFEGAERAESVVTDSGDGPVTTSGDTFVVGLGRQPRDALARMAAGDPVHVVGGAAITPDTPRCPSDGVVCPCNDVTIGQLDDVFDRGFTGMELLKRSTLAGTGTCQGGVCLPYLRSFLVERGSEQAAPFTARPMTRQLTIAEAAAGSYVPTAARTALDAVHRAAGARMERMGGWWRPWTYGDTDAEYRAVREAVSIGDVSTLGMFRITGPDAEATVQRLVPTDVRTIRPGRARYALLLDECGYVIDDGMVARDHDDSFLLTVTSGGAATAEMWIRDWSASWGHDIRLANLTFSLGAINVTGPLAGELLARAGLADPPPYLGHAPATVAGVPCTVFRLSFTGELSFELHHPAARSPELWEQLLDLGRDLGVRPHGLDALQRLRLDKGHILVGQDTDVDSTPRRLRHEWAVDLDSGDFIGRQAVIRTDRIPLDRMLVGLVSDDAIPFEGAVLFHDGVHCGVVTSTAHSTALGHGVALAWLDRLGTDDDPGPFAETVTVEGIDARVVRPPFYDPEGVRARARPTG